MEEEKKNEKELGLKKLPGEISLFGRPASKWNQIAHTSDKQIITL